MKQTKTFKCTVLDFFYTFLKDAPSTTLDPELASFGT